MRAIRGTTTARERWIVLSALLLGFGLAFAVVDLAALRRLPLGVAGPSLQIFLRIGVAVTSISTLAAGLIQILKLRK